jgi:hypothetical protein
VVKVRKFRVVPKDTQHKVSKLHSETQVDANVSAEDLHLGGGEIRSPTMSIT